MVSTGLSSLRGGRCSIQISILYRICKAVLLSKPIHWLVHSEDYCSFENEIAGAEIADVASGEFQNCSDR